MDEILTGIVTRVTYHNPVNGWSVLRVQNFGHSGQQETVTVFQARVFAGANMEFHGHWMIDPKYGRQFKAHQAIEKKPASCASLELYLGSGLIKGVGPKTAKKIVNFFKEDTLDVFDNDIDRLIEVPGIAKKKLKMITAGWIEHQAIRDVIMFLQQHGISTLFAVKIYKKYGDDAIVKVTDNPYALANDFYGIGFFSADKVALSLGFGEYSDKRIMAAITHVLAASREQGHCYLTAKQIQEAIMVLIAIDLAEQLPVYLEQMRENKQLYLRVWVQNEQEVVAYYSKRLYYDEASVANKLQHLSKITTTYNTQQIKKWLVSYCQKYIIELSDEQRNAVQHIVQHSCAILTGGPGCGKTTTTLVIVRLLEAMKKTVLLAAPTGRAAQRMGEVIGRDATTIHRLLGWKNTHFQHDENYPLDADYLIVDECSMLDISLTASLLKAVPDSCQVLFIGDPDQLPSVGAGNVLKDMIASDVIPCYQLTKIFRQAQQSFIIRYAHQINQGSMPAIASPFKNPSIWKSMDCIFIDSNEVTQEQLHFIHKVKQYFPWQIEERENLSTASPFEFNTEKELISAYQQEFIIPDKFAHVDIQQLQKSATEVESLKAVLKKVHPWSSLHYGLSAVDTILKLYLQWIPKYYSKQQEIQILTPMTRGTLGTINLNTVIQHYANPPDAEKYQLKIGERLLREGDRVIHRKNNYELNVFNGDIGRIVSIDNEKLQAVIAFYPDNRLVKYQKEHLLELDLAYAITIHKSQGSEFQIVIMPVFTQHFKMLYRNLIYTGLTRAKKLAVLVGSRQALSMAIRQQDSAIRQTALAELIALQE